jgi:hypothetical protein
MGDPYIMTSGNFIFKLHPGTYVLFAAYLLMLCAKGNPLASAIVSIREYTPLVTHLCCVVLLFVYSLICYGPSGSAFLIETFLAPALIALVLVNLSAADRRYIYRLIIALLVVNSLLGIGEAMFRAHLVPYTLSGNVEASEPTFRATALLGHPLVNALMTASLLFTVLDLRSLPLKAFLVSLFMISLLVFEGRAGFLTAAAGLGGYLFFNTFCKIFTGRYRYLPILVGMLAALFLMAMFVGVIAISGFGERIFSSLYLDDSASVRIQSWDAFKYMTTAEIIFGVAPQDIFHVMSRLGLQYPFETIENPWIYMAMQFGVFGLAVLLLALGLTCAWLYRRTAAGGRLSMLVFFIVASSYNSLASKTCTLTLLFATLTCLSGYATPRVRPRAFGNREFVAQRNDTTLEAGA